MAGTVKQEFCTFLKTETGLIPKYVTVTENLNRIYNIDSGEKLLTLNEFQEPGIRKETEGAIYRGKLDLENQSNMAG